MNLYKIGDRIFLGTMVVFGIVLSPLIALMVPLYFIGWAFDRILKKYN